MILQYMVRKQTFIAFSRRLIPWRTLWQNKNLNPVYTHTEKMFTPSVNIWPVANKKRMICIRIRFSLPLSGENTSTAHPIPKIIFFPLRFESGKTKNENIFLSLLTKYGISVILYIKIECANSIFYRKIVVLGRFSL